VSVKNWTQLVASSLGRVRHTSLELNPKPNAVSLARRRSKILSEISASPSGLEERVGVLSVLPLRARNACRCRPTELSSRSHRSFCR
jgi:hypothetical protein